MSRRKPLAASAAIAAAVAVAIPAATASGQTTPTPPQIPITPPAAVCDALQQSAQQFAAAGLPAIGDLITRIAGDIGCGGTPSR